MSDTEQKTQGEQVETPELSRILPLGNLFFSSLRDGYVTSTLTTTTPYRIDR